MGANEMSSDHSAQNGPKRALLIQNTQIKFSSHDLPVGV